MSCPLCGSYVPPGHGHACVPKPPIPGIDYPGPPRAGALDIPAKKPRRTVCADCRHYRTEQDYSRYPSEQHLCNHENARDLITGKPTECSLRNLGNCPDYQEKQP